jgi:hypothetical protein
MRRRAATALSGWEISTGCQPGDRDNQDRPRMYPTWIRDARGGVVDDADIP